MRHLPHIDPLPDCERLAEPVAFARAVDSCGLIYHISDWPCGGPDAGRPLNAKERRDLTTAT